MLDYVLSRLPKVSHPDLLVGVETSDDAGVFRLSPELALVQTVDFFTPIVDDPFTFGAIAAVNSLSDVYAMGGRPLTALSVLCYPGSGDLETLERILAGGLSKLQEAGCVLAGGHSVNDAEIKFGYAVTGLVHPDRVWANSGARVGDVLVLTKPLGTGVIATALKRGIAGEESVAAMTASMLKLNREACERASGRAVHACTDITGFGLLGHAREVALASGVTLEIEAGRVPLLGGALEAARAGAVPGGLKNNREFAGSCVEAEGVDPVALDLLYDPQTSGGLLLSVAAGEAEGLGAVIGRVVERQSAPLRVLP